MDLSNVSKEMTLNGTADDQTSSLKLALKTSLKSTVKTASAILEVIGKEPGITKTRLAGFIGGHRIENHFGDVTEMIEIGSGWEWILMF
ncbi:MAG: hypothetical protein PHE84_07805 [bacterium]|nr:hypothetical protein [bacterium]